GSKPIAFRVGDNGSHLFPVERPRMAQILLPLRTRHRAIARAASGFTGTGARCPVAFSRSNPGYLHGFRSTRRIRTGRSGPQVAARQCRVDGGGRGPRPGPDLRLAAVEGP